MQSLPSLSLLWPDGTRPAQTCTALDPQCVHDLELESTLAALADSRPGRSSIREVCLNLCTDPTTIAYRQDILDDLWRNPDFTMHLEALLPDRSALDTAHIAVDRRRSPLHEVAWRLGELEHLVSCVTGLSIVFAQVGDKVRAAGWHTLRDLMAQTAQDAVYQHLTRALPDMVRTVRAKVSVTIGVNLDGPNQGGETTYMHMVGLCQVLAQAGIWVPAARARRSPVDNIYTHYPVEEQGAKGTGRFGDEAQRLSQIFVRGTRHSLVLLNESLASTNSGASIYIAQDLVRILRRLGARALFATHLHELAADVAALNASTAGDSLIISLVASPREAGDDGPRRAYKIAPGPPLGRSYAREIAAQYGMSYDQLTALLQQRGVLE